MANGNMINISILSDKGLRLYYVYKDFSATPLKLAQRCTNAFRTLVQRSASVLCLSEYVRTQNNCTAFIQRRPNVFDVGPTLYKYYTNVLSVFVGIRAHTKQLYNIYTTSAQRLRRWSNIV